ncbi:MAG TPA: flagellin, partial [Phycisphaerales bacterium]|nr:flagellin [Phycisphaerales bacterium]
AGAGIARTLERLSTGRRINSAADDPAGMVAVSHLQTAEADINARIHALETQQFVVNSTEGGLSSITEMLQELNALTVQAANTAGMSQSERDGLQVQADAILATIDYLGNTTEFKGARILTGVNSGSIGHAAYTVSVGGVEEARSGVLADLRRGGALNLVSGNTEAAQKAVESALSNLTTRRASLGAQSNSIDSQIRAAQVELENTAAAKGQILDTDYAEETARLARDQTRQQAATYVTQLAQQQRAATVLDLLKSVVPDKR